MRSFCLIAFASFALATAFSLCGGQPVKSNVTFAAGAPLKQVATDQICVDCGKPCKDCTDKVCRCAPEHHAEAAKEMQDFVRVAVKDIPQKAPSLAERYGVSTDPTVAASTELQDLTRRVEALERRFSDNKVGEKSILSAGPKTSDGTQIQVVTPHQSRVINRVCEQNAAGKMICRNVEVSTPVASVRVQAAAPTPVVYYQKRAIRPRNR